MARPGISSVRGESVTEGDSLTFTVRLDGRTDGRGRETYYYSTYQGVDGSGGARSNDYEGVADRSTTVSSGTSSFTIDIRTLSDSLSESDENFYLYVTASSAVHPSSRQGLPQSNIGTGTIEDVPVASVKPDISSVSNARADEGDTLSFTVDLSARTTERETYYYSTYQGTARSNDYESVEDKSISVSSGRSSFTINIDATSDSLVESAEDFHLYVTASDATHPNSRQGLPQSNIGTGTIVDVPVKPDISSVSNARADEGDTLSFTVDLSARTTERETYYYSTYQGGARSEDYESVEDKSISVSSGRSSFTISIDATSDSLVESAEDFYLYVTASDATHPNSRQGLPQSNIGTGTIENVPVASVKPDISSVSNARADEGDTLSFTVDLSARTTERETYYYSTYQGTARSNDYESVEDKSISVSSGRSSFTISIDATSDSLVESAEDFHLYVTASDATHPNSRQGLPQSNIGTGTIENVPVASVKPDISSVSNARADEGDTLSFTVNLSARTTERETYYYSTYQGTARSEDYESVEDKSISVNSGRSSFTISIDAISDSLVESAEDFHLYVTASDATHPNSRQGLPQSNIGTGTIENVPVASVKPDISSVSNARADEGDTLSFTVNLSARTTERETYYYSTYQGTARSEDYESVEDKSISVNSGRSSFTISIDAISDSLVESAEDFHLYVTASDATHPNSRQGLPQSNIGTGTIEDVPVASVKPDISSVSNARADEGDTLSFTVNLSARTTERETYYYSTYQGTARSEDYESVEDKSISVNSGRSSFTISIDAISDSLVESAEDFHLYVTASDATHPNSRQGLPQSNIGTGTIEDVPVASVKPDISSVSNARADEGDTLSFTVDLSARTSERETYYYSTYQGTARSNDYESVEDKSISVSSGRSSFTISIDATSDSLVESAEDFYLYVTASDATHPNSRQGLPQSNIGTGTIENVPVASVKPDISSVSNARADEGDTLSFTVDLSARTTERETYYYSTYQGTARSEDYESVEDKSISVNSGRSSFTISIDAISDSQSEDAEDFHLYVTASDATHPNSRQGLPQSNIGTGTIEDVPVASVKPDISSVSNARADEGDTLSFTVDLSARTTERETYYYSTYQGTARSTGLNRDYEGAEDKSISVSSGRNSFTIDIDTNSDSRSESDENFHLYVTASSAVHPGSRPSSSQNLGTGTIEDVSVVSMKPEVSSVSNARGSEGDALSFTVRLDGYTTERETYYYSTYQGTAISNDYEGVADASISVAPGRNSFTIDISTASDSRTEGDEDFYLYVTTSFAVHPNSRPSLPRDIGAGTIIDVPVVPVVSVKPGVSSVSNARGSEGDALSFTVRLDGHTVQRETYYYSTYKGIARSNDYEGAEDKSISVSSGRNSFTIDIDAISDSRFEGDEDFHLYVTASSATHPNSRPSLSRNLGTGTILNDAHAPSFSVGNVSATEGNKLEFAVELERALSVDTTYYYATYRGTANLGDRDYIPVPSDGTGAEEIMFVAGSRRATFEIQTRQDSDIEDDEYFYVYIADSISKLPDGGVPTDYLTKATGTIRDDDELISPELPTHLYWYAQRDSGTGPEARAGEWADMVAVFEDRPIGSFKFKVFEADWSDNARSRLITDNTVPAVVLSVFASNRNVIKVDDHYELSVPWATILKAGRETLFTPEQAEYYFTIERNGVELKNMIDDANAQVGAAAKAAPLLSVIPRPVLPAIPGFEPSVDSASWSRERALDGDRVALTARFDSSIDGRDVVFKVYENNGQGGIRHIEDISADESDRRATVRWTVDYQPVDTKSESELYFDVYLDGTRVGQSSDLDVTLFERPAQEQPLNIDINGDDQSNVMVLGGNVQLFTDGSLGDDHYVILPGLSTRVDIRDRSGTNVLAFDSGVNIAFARMEFGSLYIDLEGGIPEEISVLAAADYRFSVGAQVNLDLQDFLEITENGLAVEGSTPVRVHAESYSSLKVISNGNIGFDSMAFGFDFAVEAEGGLSSDSYRLTRFQTNDVKILDRSGDNVIRIDEGLVIEQLDNRYGLFEFTFGNAVKLEVLAAFSNKYQIGDGAIMDAHELMDMVAENGGQLSADPINKIEGTEDDDPKEEPPAAMEGGKNRDGLRGLAGNDRIKGGPGNDIISGGMGMDTAVYEGKFEDFKIEIKDWVIQITDMKGDEGEDQLHSIEELEFGDGDRTMYTIDALKMAYEASTSEELHSELLNIYAPILVLDKNDYVPTSIYAFLDHAVLYEDDILLDDRLALGQKFPNPVFEDDGFLSLNDRVDIAPNERITSTIKSIKTLNIENIKAFVVDENGDPKGNFYFDLVNGDDGVHEDTEEWLWDNNDASNLYYDAKSDEWHSSSTIKDDYGPTVYGRVVEYKDSKDVFLQYYFFYTENDWRKDVVLDAGVLGFGFHEGDWEFMQIKLGSDLLPENFMTSIHINESQVRNPYDSDVQRAGNHVVLYIADGGHATYLTSGTTVAISKIAASFQSEHISVALEAGAPLGLDNHKHDRKDEWLLPEDNAFLSDSFAVTEGKLRSNTLDVSQNIETIYELVQIRKDDDVDQFLNFDITWGKDYTDLDISDPPPSPAHNKDDRWDDPDSWISKKDLVESEDYTNEGDALAYDGPSDNLFDDWAGITGIT